jgi:ATP adenylyltransferase
MAEQLWAPWRMTYIEKPSTGTDELNIFVDLPAEDNDRENLILYRGQTAFVMLNAYPYTNGHLLIAPYRQTPNLEDLDDAELLEINQLLAKSIRWTKKCYNPDGFNVGINIGRAGGAGIPRHIHWHIVPRWSGDTNFMTTVGEVRVLPQTLSESYERLKEIADADI